jgi:NAD(P)-dependent dehydrogenase (short-subunit alcohol dehydrogenase family)
MGNASLADPGREHVDEDDARLWSCLSPPLDFRPQWFSRHPAYSAAKFGMRLYMMAMSAEFRAEGI